jgi:hypothetical protein
VIGSKKLLDAAKFFARNTIKTSQSWFWWNPVDDLGLGQPERGGPENYATATNSKLRQQTEKRFRNGRFFQQDSVMSAGFAAKDFFPLCSSFFSSIPFDLQKFEDPKNLLSNMFARQFLLWSISQPVPQKWNLR